MIRCYRLAFFLFLSLTPASAIAQEEDEGLLYFPPELTVVVGGPASAFVPSFEDEESFNGIERGPERSIELKTEVEVNTAPLLPLVFFDAGRSDFPARYHTFNGSMETDTYTDTTGWEAWSGVEMYHDVVNIIGYRMQWLPGTTIELEGGYSTEPGEDSNLGQARAEVVRDYLVTVWKIEPERIVLRPPRRMCDPSDNIFLQEEAQRVEIHPSDFALVRPVRYQGRAYYIASPEFMITLQPNTETPADVAAIEIVLRAGDRILNRTEVAGSPDSTLYRLHCSWITTAEYFEESSSLEVYALVYQMDGTTRTSKSVRIPVAVTTDTTFYDVGSEVMTVIILPFFFAGQTNLNPLQTWLLDELLRHRTTVYPESRGMKTLSVHATTEAGEFGSEDKEFLYSRRAEYQSLQSQLDAIYGSAVWDAPMFLHSIKSDEVPGVMSRLHGGQEENLEKALAGTGELSSLDFSDEMVTGVSRLLKAREKGVANYLITRCAEMWEYDTLSTSAPDLSEDSSSRWSGMRAQYHYTPEERFYHRSVKIMMTYPYTSYRSSDEAPLNYDYIERVDEEEYLEEETPADENEEYNEDEDSE